MSNLSSNGSKSLSIKFLLITCFIYNSCGYVLRISNKDLSLKIDETANLTLSLDSKDINKNIRIRFTCNETIDITDFKPYETNCRVIKGFQQIYELNATQNTIELQLEGIQPGRQTLVAYTEDNITDAKNAFVRINVGRTKAIDVISMVIGWLYFLAWSVSFYPQIWTNFRRKSVVGLNFDYIGLNITGFLFYSFFNVALFYSPLIQKQFEEKYPRSLIPVEDNDVVFALHAVFATIVVIVQCFIYERQNQTVSIFSKGFLVIAWTAAAILAILVPTTHWLNWLTYIYFFSYVKLTITIIKYIPQAWYNYKRQSTVGWSIGNILLDFTGGALSILQMFLLAYNYDDWMTIFKNFTKFGLGMVSILFDVLFIVQHYCLYRNSDTESTRLTNSLNTSSPDLEPLERDLNEN